MVEVLRTRSGFVVMFIRMGESIDFKILHKVRGEGRQFIMLRENAPCNAVRIADAGDGVRVASDIKVIGYASDFEHVRDDEGAQYGEGLLPCS